MENTNITNVQVDDLILTPKQTAIIDKVIEYYEPKIGDPKYWIDFEEAMADIRRDILSA